MEGDVLELGHRHGYKLLALDMDGTLLTSRGDISPRTQAALRRAATAGIGVTLATGRRFATVKAQIAALGITLPVILQTGAQIVEPATGRLLYCNPLSGSDVAVAVDLLLAGGLQPILYENSVLDQRLCTGPAERDTRAM